MSVVPPGIYATASSQYTLTSAIRDLDFLVVSMADYVITGRKIAL